MPMGACDTGHLPHEAGRGGWGLGAVITFTSMVSVTYFFYEVLLPDIPTTLPAGNKAFSTSASAKPYRFKPMPWWIVLGPL